MPPAIRVENLSKQYSISHAKDHTLREALTRLTTRPLRFFRRESTSNEIEQFWALRDVNFTIERGEIVGILGRNGAGKSTLLKILSRITRPTAGRVSLRGRVGSLLEVGVGFNPELSGRENIFLSGAIMGMTRKEIQRKFDEIVAFSEVERFLESPVKRYSSGMYVRLAFSVAAHLEPDILILDEVLSVGDASFQQKCEQRIQTLVNNDHRTILVVSHNAATLNQLCSKGLFLHNGCLLHYGSMDTAVRMYQQSDAGRMDTLLSFVRPTTDLGWSGEGISCPETIDTATTFQVRRTYTIEGADAPGNFVITYYAASNPDPGLSNYLLLAQEKINTSEGKQKGVHSGDSPRLRIGCPGSYYIIAVLNPLGRFSETDVGNNRVVSQRAVQVRGQLNVILDKGSPGYTERGPNWHEAKDVGLRGGVRYTWAGCGETQACWELVGVPVGEYRIQATWNADWDHATDAPYRVYDGGKLVATFRVNQQPGPEGEIIDGHSFQTVGSVFIESGTLRVVLSNDANGNIIAYALRIEGIENPS